MTTTFTADNFVDVIGLGRANVTISIINTIKSLTQVSLKDETDHIEYLRGLYKRLSNYAGPLSAPHLPKDTMDSFVVRFLGALAPEKQIYYGLLALFWRSSLPWVEADAVLAKRLDVIGNLP